MDLAQLNYYLDAHSEYQKRNKKYKDKLKYIKKAMFKKTNNQKQANAPVKEASTEFVFVGKAWENQKGLIIKIDADVLEEVVKGNQEKYINQYGDLKFFVGRKKEIGKAKETHYVTILKHEEKS